MSRKTFNIKYMSRKTFNIKYMSRKTFNIKYTSIKDISNEKEYTNTLVQKNIKLNYNMIKKRNVTKYGNRNKDKK